MDNEISRLLADIKDQVAYLREIGVETLNADLPEVKTAVEPVRTSLAAASLPPNKFERAMPPARPTVPVMKPNTTPTGGTSRLSQMPSLTKRTPIMKTDANPITPAETREPSRSIQIAEKQADTMFGDISQALPETTETVQDIRMEIGDCTRCPLHTGRTQIVHSTGNLQADLMFVGEAPGADEDAQGVPFVGRAGQLLTKIIESIGISRDEVFIGNINRCRPPGNRQPLPIETETCRPYLLREIAVVRPKVVVVLGNTATQNLLGTKVGISKLRGNFQDYFGVKVMPTFHPAYLLRDPHKKREVWEDMKKVREYLNNH